jgi:hypothetical protein
MGEMVKVFVIFRCLPQFPPRRRLNPNTILCGFFASAAVPAAARPSDFLNRETLSAAEPLPNRDWPQKNAKIAKNKLHKSLPLSSLRSFAAIILLELHDSPV